MMVFPLRFIPGAETILSWCNRPSEVCTLRKGRFAHFDFLTGSSPGSGPSPNNVATQLGGPRYELTPPVS
jgi:hypothetical protein